MWRALAAGVYHRVSGVHHHAAARRAPLLRSVQRVLVEFSSVMSPTHSPDWPTSPAVFITWLFSLKDDILTFQPLHVITQ